MPGATEKKSKSRSFKLSGLTQDVFTVVNTVGARLMHPDEVVLDGLAAGLLTSAYQYFETSQVPSGGETIAHVMTSTYVAALAGAVKPMLVGNKSAIDQALIVGGVAFTFRFGLGLIMAEYGNDTFNWGNILFASGVNAGGIVLGHFLFDSLHSSPPQAK